MTFRQAIDAFIADWRREGRINSDRTEIAYRSRLMAHAEDVSNRDPRTVGRADIKRTDEGSGSTIGQTEDEKDDDATT